MLIKLGAEYTVALSQAPFATSALLCLLARFGAINLGRYNQYITTEVCIIMSVIALVIYLLDAIPIPAIGDGVKVVIEKLKTVATFVVTVALSLGLFSVTVINNDAVSVENSSVNIEVGSEAVEVENATSAYAISVVLLTIVRTIVSAFILVNIMLLRFTIDTISTLLGTIRFTGISQILETINTVMALGMVFIATYAPWLALVINIIIIAINLLVIKKIIRLNKYNQTMIIRPLWIRFVNKCFKKDYSLVKISNRELKLLSKFDLLNNADMKKNDIRPVFVGKKCKIFKFKKLDKGLYLEDSRIILINKKTYTVREMIPNTKKFKLFRNRCTMQIVDTDIKVIYNEKLTTYKGSVQ